MPYSITTKDGITLQNIPDDVPADSPELKARVAQIRSQSAGIQAEPRPPEPTLVQRVMASAPVRFAMGTGADFVSGAAQAVEHAVPDRVRRAVNDFGNYLADLGLPVSYSPEGGFATDAAIADSERRMLEARTAVAGGDPGTDVARLAGNIASPVNYTIARALPIKPGMSTLAKAGTGAVLGASGAALQPVTNVDGDFGMQKAAQVVLGGGTGGVMTPVMSRFGEVLARNVNRFVGDKEVAGARASVNTDALVRQALAETGQSVDDVPQDVLAGVRQQVLDALKSGRKLDAAALLRKADADAVGVKLTQGQLTRDPAQFAAEKNLRGVAGVGEPLLQRYEQQNQRFTQLLNDDLGGGQAAEAFPAGERIAGALRSADEGMSRQVADLYGAARAAAGKDLDVPLQGLAQDAARIIDDFADKVPTAVRNRLASYGLLGGTQTKVYSPAEADSLLKLINSHVGNDRATNTALGQLRDAVKRTMTEGEVPDVFAPARQAARTRFELHDAVPALEDAASGRTAPDDFVRRYIVGGKTNDVKGMASLLSQTDPSAFQEARKQLGAALSRAAFGENVTGDRIFSAERFNRALRTFGSEKLRAFFTPEEVARLQALGRVAAYANTVPVNAPVNFSNTASTMVNLLRSIPGMPGIVAIGEKVVAPVRDSRVVSAALNETVPNVAAELPPEVARLLGPLTATGSVASGALAAMPVR